MPAPTQTDNLSILTAASISDTFSSVSGTPPTGLSYSLTYGTTSVLLTLLGGSSPSGVTLLSLNGLTGNCIAIANYLNSVSSEVPGLSAIIADLALLSPGPLQNALSTISPASYAAATFAGQTTLFVISDVVSHHLSDLRFLRRLEKGTFEPMVAQDESITFADEEENVADEEEADEEEDEAPYGSSQTIAKGLSKYAFWAQGLGEWLSQDAQSIGVPSFDAFAGGAIVGFDRYYENGLLGAAASFAETWVDLGNDQGNDRIGAYTALFYFTGTFNNGYIEINLLGSYNPYKGTRHIFFPGFDADAEKLPWGAQGVPHVALGYDANYSWGTIEPFVQADCAITYQEGFSEHGAGVLDMALKGRFPNCFAQKRA